jgi:hypothetical protein
MTGQRRYLAVGLNLSQAQPEEQPDGSLLVRNVPMLKVGTWTDSVVGTPLHYPLETLAVDATNWKSNSYWSRHSGGTPHDFDDKIALIETPRFMGDGVYADLRFHRSTQKSRDAAAYLMRMRELGQDVYSSVEHYWEETYNAELQRMEATGLTFLGAAMVDQGACRTCKIPQPAAMAAGSGNPDDGTQRSLTDYAGNNPKTPDNTGIDETMTAEDIKKLEDQIKALSDQNATIMKALEAQTAPPKKEEKSDEIKALEAALVAKDVEIRAASEAQAALDARIKALEQDGTTKTGGNQPAELSEPMNAGVSIDRKTGTIRRV